MSPFIGQIQIIMRYLDEEVFVEKSTDVAFSHQRSRSRTKIRCAGVCRRPHSECAKRRPSISSIDQFFHLAYILDRSGQILISILCDQNIVLDSDTSHLPVLIQYIKVDVRSMNRVP